MNNNDLRGDADYNIWRERSVIATCLKSLGLDTLAKEANNPNTTSEKISNLLSIIKSEAWKAKDMDVLEDLHFAGLG